MQKSRLVEVFLELNKKDLRELKKFVRSPFFNQRPDVIALFDYLETRIPFKNSKEIDRKVVFTSLFPGEAYKEKKISYAMSFLFKSIKEYLAYTEFNANPVNSQLNLVSALRKKGVDRSFEAEIKVAEKLLHDQPHRNMEYHFQYYQIHKEFYDHSILENRKQEQRFKQMNDQLNLFFMATKLQNRCILLSHKALSGVEMEQLFTDEIVKYVEDHENDQLPAVAIYYYIFKALNSEESEDYFEKLKLLMQEHHKVFPKGEFKDVLLLSINYAIKKLNEGNRSYLRELLDLYKEGLASGALLDGNQLSHFTYHNIAKVGIGLQEYDWVKHFLYNYKEKINKKLREDTYNYNLAILYYRQPDYEKVMSLLSQVDFKDVTHNLTARQMLLKIYYERNEVVSLQSLLDSFKNYIYRHKDIGYTRQNYLNLIRYVRKLLALDRYDKEAVERLRRKISSEKYLVEREWLLEQV